MQTLEQLHAAWDALDARSQVEAWDEFTRDVDDGQAGWNRFYRILQPLYEVGEVPAPLLNAGPVFDQRTGLQEPEVDDWLWDSDPIESLVDRYGEPPF